MQALFRVNSLYYLNTLQYRHNLDYGLQLSGAFYSFSGPCTLYKHGAQQQLLDLMLKVEALHFRSQQFLFLIVFWLRVGLGQYPQLWLVKP